MAEIRDQMMSQAHWGSDPSSYPDVHWLAEQANSPFYRERVSNTHLNLSVKKEIPIESLRTAEYVDHEGSRPISVVWDEMWRGPEDELQEVIDAHPLGEAAFPQDDEPFEQEAQALTEDMLYRGIGAGLWVQEDELLIRRSRKLLVPSHINEYWIGVESYQVAPTQVLEEAGVDPKVIKRSKNVVMPKLIVGETYDMEPRSRRVEHLAKLVSVQVIEPPAKKVTGIFIPKQRGRQA